MDVAEIVTAAEVEQLTPDERHRLVNAHVVTNLDDVDPAFLARVRTEGRRLLVERDLIDPDAS